MEKARCGMSSDLTAVAAHHLDQYRGLDDAGRYELRRFAEGMSALRDPRSSELWRQVLAMINDLEAGEL